MTTPEIPFIPEMYEQSRRSSGDGPAVVMWYATDRATQDKYVETFERYLKRGTVQQMHAKISKLEQNRSDAEVLYERVMIGAQLAASADRGTDAFEPPKGQLLAPDAFERVKAGFDKQIASLTEEIGDIEPFANDDERDAMRLEMLSLVVRRVRIDTRHVAWPETISAQKDLLIRSGIAPMAWEQLLHGIRDQRYWSGALGKS